MIKQVILDMENQYLQVKTQVAFPSPTTHAEKKWQENEDPQGLDAQSGTCRDKARTIWRARRWTATRPRRGWR